jgi:hypothetical protein
MVIAARSGDPRPGPQAQLAQPVPEAMAIERHRRPGQDPIDGRVGRLGRDEPGVGDDRHGRDGIVAADARAGGCPETGIEPDLDQLDPPIEDVGQGADRPAGGSPRVVRSAPDLVEQLAQGRPGRFARRGGGGEEELAGPFAR